MATAGRGFQFIAVSVACLALARASAAQSDRFEDLARRASDAIDSDPQQAAELYQQGLALKPDWAEGWMYRGAALFQLHRYREARESLLKGVSLDSSKGTPFAFLGMVDYELGDYKTALADILKGESIGLPDDPNFLREVRYRAALVCLRSYDFGKALAQLTPLIKRNIQSDEVTTAVGLGALGLRYLPSTLPPARRPLVILAGRAAALFLEQRYEEAAPVFQELKAKFTNEPGVHYMVGVFLIGRDLSGAEQEFRKVIQMSPTNVLARVQLANLLMKGGERKEALELASEAARLAPADPLSEATLGRALFLAGKTTDALAALQRAEEIAPGAAKVHLYLVQAYRQAGRTADAQREKALWERLHSEQEPELITGELDQ